MSRNSRSRNVLSSSSVIFLIWCVALRASKSGPSVQPLIVLARMTVGALEVAVHDEDEVVEVLAGGDRQAVGAFGLVHLAVADEAPHLRLARVGELVIDQVPIETRLGDRVDRAQPH